MSRLIRDTDLLEELEKKYEEYNEIAEQHISEAHEIQAGTMRLAISIVKSQPPASQWIPCSSGRMPENGQTVVVTIGPTDAYRHMAVLNYYKTKPKRFTDNDWQGEGFYHYIWGDWIKRENVIAWMPAEPYQEEKL